MSSPFIPSDIDRIKQIESRLLFHGTGEDLEGALRGGGYDDILWTAETSVISQNYIPESGSSVHFSLPSDTWRVEEVMKPSKETIWEQFFEEMGCQFEDVVWRGRELESWRCVGDPPTIQDAHNWLAAMGYEGEKGYGSTRYAVKQAIIDGKFRIMPADYKLVGELCILRGKENLKIYDHPHGDLLEPAYHHHGVFRQARDVGYDGVKINDYLQSRHWGNFGHQSIGLFPSGIAKLQYECIPATNFDSPQIEDWNQGVTPEFAAWARAQ